MFCQFTRGDGGESVDRANGKVEPPGDEYQRAGGRDGQRRRLLFENVDQVQDREEVGTRETEDQEKNEERDRDAGETPRREQTDGEGLDADPTFDLDVEELSVVGGLGGLGGLHVGVHYDTAPSLLDSVNAAASTFCSFIASPESSVTMRP